MTITQTEIADLLTMAAAVDLRTVGRSDISAWHAMATEAGWTFPRARKALVEHLANSEDRLTPAVITKRIAHVRQVIRRALDPELYRAPAELADDPSAERAWLKDAFAKHVNAGLDTWAQTGRIADTPKAATAIAELVVSGRLALTAAPEATDAAA